MTAPRIFATDDMELALRRMAERNRDVLALLDYKTVRPIRMRTLAKLSDLEIDLCWAWRPDAAERMEAWKRRGGIMQYRCRPNARRPLVPSSDAILFAECPLQWDAFDSLASCARQEAVVYRPPVWDGHTRTIDMMFPPRESYEAIEAYIDARPGPPFKHSMFEHSASFTAEPLLSMYDWTEKQLRYLLRGYPHAVHRWHPYTLRLKPEDPNLRWAWDVLCAQPQLKPRTHLIRFNLVRPRIPGFQSMLKALVRGKYVRADECIYDADLDRRRKDIDEREAVNNMRRGKWFKLRNFVDELPEYPID